MHLLIISNNPSRPSFRQRIGIYIPRLREEGIVVEVAKLPAGAFARWKLYKHAAWYDAVFLHKKRLNTLDAHCLRKYARKLIYDFDDAIMYNDKAPTRSGRKRQWDFRRTAKMADVIIAGNTYLAEHAGRFAENVVILPTGLKVDNYSPAKLSEIDDDRVRLVWIGSESTLSYLQGISEALEEIGRRFENVELRIICDRFFDLENIKIEKIDWTVDGQYQALASCDIGLAPLPDDNFTRGKCGFKILQYAAAGLCVVSSPVGVNTNFIEQGGYGYLANSIPDWVEKVSTLVRDKATRKEFSEKAIKSVHEFDVDPIGKRLLEIITQAMK